MSSTSDHGTPFRLISYLDNHISRIRGLRVGLGNGLQEVLHNGVLVLLAGLLDRLDLLLSLLVRLVLGLLVSLAVLIVRVASV